MQTRAPLHSVPKHEILGEGKGFGGASSFLFAVSLVRSFLPLHLENKPLEEKGLGVQRTWSLRNVPLSPVFKTQLWDFVWTRDSCLRAYNTSWPLSLR